MKDYKHEWGEGFVLMPSGDKRFECGACGLIDFERYSEPIRKLTQRLCPEKIIREAIRRIKEEKAISPFPLPDQPEAMPGGAL